MATGDRQRNYRLMYACHVPVHVFIESNLPTLRGDVRLPLPSPISAPGAGHATGPARPACMYTAPGARAVQARPRVQKNDGSRRR